MTHGDALSYFSTNEYLEFAKSWQDKINAIRLPRVSQIASAGGFDNWDNLSGWYEFKNKVNTNYLYNYLSSCYDYGCSKELEGDNAAWGYWLEDIVPSNSNYYILTGAGGISENLEYYGSSNGVRPFININKDLLN